jgi:glycosyltransferase involved in cell wall biosynthesis
LFSKKEELISIIVPAYNEENLLPKSIKEITFYLEKSRLDYDLIIVEDLKS